MTAKKAAGHSAKHVTSRKHMASKKHSPTAAKPAAARTAAKVTAKAKHATHAKARSFAVGDWLPVCSFEAVAMSLRLAGQRVSDDDVAGLWWLAGAREASIAEALGAAARFGLAGHLPVSEECAQLSAVPASMDCLVQQPHAEAFLACGEVGFLADQLVHGTFGHALILGVDRAADLYAGQVEQPRELAAVGHVAVDDLVGDVILHDLGDDLTEVPVGDRVAEYSQRIDAAQLKPPVDLLDSPLSIHGLTLGAPAACQSGVEPATLSRRRTAAAPGQPGHPFLILGVDRPGPHAVLATPDGWWSWGILHDPWPCRIEEAWAVSWS